MSIDEPRPPTRRGPLRSRPVVRRPLRKLAAAAAISGVGAIAVPAPAPAATFTVDTDSGDAQDSTGCNASPTDDCNLADAIVAANDNPGPDTITFASTITGEIDLTLSLPGVSEALSIEGPGADVLTLDRGGREEDNGREGIFFMGTDGEPVSIDGLTLRRGDTDHSSDYPGFRGAAGAAIYAVGTPVTISNSTLTENVTRGFDSPGGAVFAVGAPLTVINSTLSGNSTRGAFSQGGAIAVEDAPLTIANSTLSGNSTARNNSSGGAVYAFAGSPVTIESSTIAGNIAGGDGGGAGLHFDNAVLGNTIVADNEAVGKGNDLATGSPGSTFFSSFSLIESTEGAAFSDGGGNVLGEDPRLAPLADNGGPTQTRALDPASPAYDTGCSLEPADQRGVSRPEGGGDDIGAFELEAGDGLPRGCVRDTELVDADATAKKKQSQGGKRIKVKIKGGAGEAVMGSARGRITVNTRKGKRAIASAKRFELETVRKTTDAGEQTIYRLKPSKQDSRKVFKLLRKGKDLRANPSLELTDAAGNAVTEKRVVRLRAKRR